MPRRSLLLSVSALLLILNAGCPISLTALQNALNPDMTDPNDVIPGNGDVAEPIGSVDGTLCDDTLLAIETGDETLVFEPSGSGSFQFWLRQDNVSYDGQTGELVNVTRQLRQAASLIGSIESSTTILDISPIVGSIRLADSTFWILTGSDLTVISTWLRFHDVIVIKPPSGAERTILYVDFCEAERFEPG
ncbi:MAG: hypothetical protein KDA32_05850 [Phycisphaerales bacterium]|nr:hypothetical protein [Phycisphaerales bacterium]